MAMKITILCVGKIRERFYREAAARYEIIEFLPTKMSDGLQALLH